MVGGFKWRQAAEGQWPSISYCEKSGGSEAERVVPWGKRGLDLFYFFFYGNDVSMKASMRR